LPTSGDTYQGLVQLTTPDLASNIENYFATSEQLETRIRISVKENDNWPCVVGCLLMPAATTARSG
jgi:redox-regulated HSP33 family molecular chaperone